MSPFFGYCNFNRLIDLEFGISFDVTEDIQRLLSEPIAKRNPDNLLILDLAKGTYIR